MIKVQGKLNEHVWLACSGGVDSMAVLDFLLRKHKVTVIFVNHGTETSAAAYEFLNDYRLFDRNKGFGMASSVINTRVPKGVSQEEHWRNERYKVFHSITDQPVITCHHLDDCVETWIWSSMHGEGKIIPYANKNVIRPFRLNKKEEFVNWCNSKDVPWIEDESNDDTKYMRNYIRHTMMPNVLHINPGIQKVIRKKVVADGS